MDKDMPFIASGAYGCIFKPHLKCSNKRYSGAVGKIFYEEKDHDYEKKVLERVNKLDPDHTFTLPLLDSCSTTNSSLEECNGINTSHSHMQLIMPYGGKGLDIILKKNLSSSKFHKLFAAMEPLMNGLILLSNNKIVHQDIKLQNLLLKDKVIYLIDFGIMETHRSVFKSSIIESNYPFFPPEYKYFAKKHKTMDIFIASFLENFLYSFKIAGKSYQLLHLIEDLLHVDMTKELKAIRPQRLPDRIDIYQTGIVFLLMYAATSYRNSFIEKFIWHLLHPDSTKRATPYEALKEYKEILDK